MNTAKIANRIEKGHYPFKSYPRTSCETVLFAGCALPSQFPRTMDALARACRQAGFGVVYDCCGQPLSGFGGEKAAVRVVRNVNRRLAALHCKRLVLACPNCLSHLSGKLACETVGILSVLDELELDSNARFGKGRLFIPCPDKPDRLGERELRRHADLSDVETMERAGCCGLRSEIMVRGPEAVERASRKVLDAAGDDPIYSYCASCLGQFARIGHADCRHVLSPMLGIDEQPDVQHAFANRAKRKFDRGNDPMR